ncbi:1949_t:CDS:2, partial [Diversispora eburnea]
MNTIKTITISPSIRTGTIILASINLFFTIGGAVAFLGKPQEYAPDLAKAVTLIFGIAFIISTLVTLFGIIGSILKAAAVVRISSVMLWSFVIIYIIIALITITNQFPNKQTAIERCTSDTSIISITDIDDYCQDRESWRIIRNIVLVVHRYAKKLEEDYYEHRKIQKGVKGVKGGDTISKDFNLHATH